MECRSIIILSSSSCSPFPLNHNPNKIPKVLRKSQSALKTQSLSLMLTCFQSPLPSLASINQSPSNSKIDIESVVVSVDEFFNRYPYFVAGVVFVWLFVIPATQEYLRKYKFISAIEAFKKLKEDPDCQLLDIRDSKTLRVLPSPNLKLLNKNAVQLHFSEEAFVQRVKDCFQDPATTTLCILDK